MWHIDTTVIRLLDGTRCVPQKHHRFSRSPFFQPIFVVQPSEDVLDSDPASGW
jgi:hypothetical protein